MWKALSLHVANAGLIPNITYYPPSLSGVVPEDSPSALLGVDPKQTNKTIKKVIKHF